MSTVVAVVALVLSIASLDPQAIAHVRRAAPAASAALQDNQELSQLRRLMVNKERP